MHIRDFQDLMHRMYYHRDSRRGVAGTYDWLVDEVKELGEALREEDKQALENEFADIIAWLASLANVVHIDLERATIRKYDGKCPKCGDMPCTCTF